MNIYLHVCAWCFYAGRLSDEYEGLYVYIYLLLSHFFWFIFMYTRESLPLSLSISLLFFLHLLLWASIFKCVRLSVALDIRTACECRHISLCRIIYFVILRRASRYIHPRVYDAFYDRSMANLPQPPLSLLQLIADICRRNATANAENIDKISIWITLVGYSEWCIKRLSIKDRI